MPQRRDRHRRGALLLLLQRATQRTDRREPPQLAQRYLTRQPPADLITGLNSQKRVAPQREEVVLHADILPLQQIAPHRQTGVLPFAPRRDELTHRPFRLRQGLSGYLAVFGQRQLRQLHQRLRHHVRRQLAAQVLSQRLGGDRLIGNVVRGQAGLRLPDEHAATGGHARIGEHRMFYLPQLDAIAVQLDLLIEAPHELHVAILQPSARVAGAVHPLLQLVMPEETLGGALRIAVIPARQALTRQIDFPSHPRRGGPSPGVQDIATLVRQRFAVRNADRPNVLTARDLVQHGEDRRLRRAAGAAKTAVRRPGQAAFRQRGGDPIAPHHHRPQRRCRPCR